QRDGTCVLVALNPANAGRVPGVPWRLRAARTSVHPTIHGSDRALSPPGRLSRRDYKNAESMGRALWWRRRCRESGGSLAGVSSRRQALCDVSVMPSDGTSSRVGYIRQRYPHLQTPVCNVHCDPQMLQVEVVLQVVNAPHTPAALHVS